MEKIDVAIMGGGIVGLMTAREILVRYPEWTICVFDKEMYLGEHSSGRNSGVLHAGLYYDYGSLKHRLCMEGNQLWDDLAQELNVPMKRCGKFIVAREESEKETLEQIFEKAKKNEVPLFRKCSEDEKNDLNQYVYCWDALYSGRTGIIDQTEALAALKNDITARGGIILLSHEVNSLLFTGQSYQLGFTNQLQVESQYLFNAAGLGGIELRKMLQLEELENYFVKGTYIKNSQKNPFQQLIYPVPEKGLLGLGIHLTIDMAGEMKFGPNTQEISTPSYAPDLEQLDQMKSGVRRFFKTLEVEKLGVDYCGIRSKIKLKGLLYTDFWIQSPIKNYVEFLGIESPGFTSSPAIAKHGLRLVSL
jgi:L-2-hydroxyglutarate oxidase LhgO